MAIKKADRTATRSQIVPASQAIAGTKPFNGEAILVIPGRHQKKAVGATQKKTKPRKR